MSDRAMTRDEIDAKRKEFRNAFVLGWCHATAPEWPTVPLLSGGKAFEAGKEAERLAAERYPYPRTLRERRGAFYLWRWNPNSPTGSRLEHSVEGKWSVALPLGLVASEQLFDIWADLKAHPYVEGD